MLFLILRQIIVPEKTQVTLNDLVVVNIYKKITFSCSRTSKMYSVSQIRHQNVIKSSAGQSRVLIYTQQKAEYEKTKTE